MLEDINPALFEHQEEWNLYLWMLRAEPRLQDCLKREDYKGYFAILCELVR